MKIILLLTLCVFFSCQLENLNLSEDLLKSGSKLDKNKKEKAGQVKAKLKSIRRKAGAKSTTNSSNVTFSVEFDKEVTNPSVDDFELVKLRTVFGDISSIQNIDQKNFEVHVQNVSGDGSISIKLNDLDSSIKDLENNKSLEEKIITATESFMIDNTAPMVRLNNVSNINSVNVNNLFLSGTCSEDGRVVQINVDQRSYSQTCFAQSWSLDKEDGLSFDSIADQSNIAILVNHYDIAGNSATPAHATIAKDTSKPQLLKISRKLGSLNPTTSSSVTFSVNFNESVSLPSLSDFELIKSSELNGTISTISPISSTEFEVGINSLSGSGTLSLNLKDLDYSIKDNFGNSLSLNTSQGNESFTKEEIVVPPPPSSGLIPSFPVKSAQTPEWYNGFTPKRIIFVDDDESESQSEAMAKISNDQEISFLNAINLARAGDLVVMREGRYQLHLGHIDMRNLTGTESSPIVFRAARNEHVDINGYTNLGAHVWLWGLDIEASRELGDMSHANNPAITQMQQADGSRPTVHYNHDFTSLVHMGQPGSKVINCKLHDNWIGVNVGMWKTNTGGALYGNTIYNGSYANDNTNGHNIYSQNRFYTFGEWKYIEGNILLDSMEARKSNGEDKNIFNLHVYAQSTADGPVLTHYKIRDNIFRSGKSIVGGTNFAVSNIHNDRNVYLNENISFGYGRPTTYYFRYNFLGDSRIGNAWHWGKDSGFYQKEHPTEISHNEFAYSMDRIGAVNFQMGAGGYDSSGVRQQNAFDFDTADVFDHNVYHVNEYFSSIQIGLQVRDQSAWITNLDRWRSFTKETIGVEYGKNSEVKSDLRAPKVIIKNNVMDPDRVHVAVFNPMLAPSVNLDLSSAFYAGSNIRIYKAKEFLEGNSEYNGPSGNNITLQIQDDKYPIYIVVKTN